MAAPKKARVRRLWAASAGSLLIALTLGGAGGTRLVANADTPLTFSAVNGTANAGAVRTEAGSDAFPNFRNGAFNNYYPLAHSHIDGSPASEASASPFDTGPLGQAIASGTFNTPKFKQVQYANANYPPGSPKAVTFGNPGSLYASATAGPTGASALSAFPAAGGLPIPGASSAIRLDSLSLTRLETMLYAWRVRYLSPDALFRYPSVHPSAATADGVTSATAQSSATIDPVRGLLLAGESRVQSATFAGGMIRLGTVDVAVSINNNGTTPTPQVSIAIGSASVAGVPVKIDQNGVTVANGLVPGLGAVTAQASTALSDVLAQAGLAIRTLAPNVTRSTNELSIDASGVEVSFTQPATLPGVPRQQVVQQLGDVLNDSLAVAGVPLTASPGATSPASSPSSSGSTSIFIPGTPAIPGTPGTPGTPAASGGAGAGNSTASSSALGAPRLIVHKTKPLDLVLLYFLWQSLIIGTVASLWWRRLELAEAEA